MRLTLVAVAALSLAACSKPATTTSTAGDSAAPAADATAAAPASATAPGPQASDAAGGNAAVKAPHPENAGPPAAGANSFTEGQAKGHIENSGYTNVTGLSKDDKGVWHATATKDGKTANVSLDFKGNVVTN